MVDLHTHTNFSACANKENTWQKLLKKAESEKLDILSNKKTAKFTKKTLYLSL